MTKGRYYCFPDIHARNDLLQKALSFVYDQNPEGGKIVFLGDYIDRGPDNYGVLQTVMNPPEKWEFVCLLGNHEQMFYHSYNDRSQFYDIKAAKDIAGYKQDDWIVYDHIHHSIDRSIIRWMENLPFFHIEDKNVFAHAFYDDTLLPKDQYIQACIWDRMSDHETFWNDNQGLYLTHGHTPKKHAPVLAPNRVNLDAGAVFYGRYVIGEYHKGLQGPFAFHEFE